MSTVAVCGRLTRPAPRPPPRAQTAAESSACLLGMVLMPAMLSASSACPESDAGGAYNASASGTLQSLQEGAAGRRAPLPVACLRGLVAPRAPAAPR